VDVDACVIDDFGEYAYSVTIGRKGEKFETEYSVVRHPRK
jgi:hypothetical protein